MDPKFPIRGLSTRAAAYGVSDISLVISIRAHCHNPWILPRLRMLAGHYTPTPSIVIVDLGSAHSFQNEIAEVCAERDFAYVRVEDDGLYSAAVGRNRGAEAAQTDLLFFCDIDCFGESDLFARLAKHANDIRLGACFDQLVVLPAYHLTHDVTEAVTRAETHVRSDLVAKAMAAAMLSARNAVVEYVDPFSNFLLCRRDFFSFVGGYNENFRGHGSEDFEFLLRAADEIRQFPLPRKPSRDDFSPIRNTFFSRRKQYKGFRRLGELMAYPAEAAGLRIAHLHHERSREGDDWYAQRDVRRKRFKRQAQPYLTQPGAALGYDWLAREKAAVVILGAGRAPADLALPLRQCGYRLTPWVVPGARASAELEAVLETHEEIVVVQPGLPRNALSNSEWQRLAAERKVWVIAVGDSAGEFVYRWYDRGELVFEGTARFRRPSSEGAGADAGWLFEQLPFVSSTVERAAATRSFAASSYASGKLQLALCRDDVEAQSQSTSLALSSGDAPLFIRRLNKLLRNPARFLADSRFALLRSLGALLVTPSGRGYSTYIRARLAKRMPH